MDEQGEEMAVVAQVVLRTFSSMQLQLVPVAETTLGCHLTNRLVHLVVKTHVQSLVHVLARGLYIACGKRITTLWWSAPCKYVTAKLEGVSIWLRLCYTALMANTFSQMPVGVVPCLLLFSVWLWPLQLTCTDVADSEMLLADRAGCLYSC